MCWRVTLLTKVGLFDAAAERQGVGNLLLERNGGIEEQYATEVPGDHVPMEAAQGPWSGIVPPFTSRDPVGR